MSFVKDLDQSTLHMVRHFDNNHDRWMKKFRATLIVVIWVGGDKEKLAEWANKNNIKNVPLAVIDANDSTLDQWRINPKTNSTTVLTMPRMPKEVFVNFNPMQHILLENAMEKHFERYLVK